MELSIIIPAYNAEPYIEHLIQRLKPQINDQVEVIVVDDGSKFPYLPPYEWVNVIRQKNKGLAGARNTGLKKAKGKYIAFIDADDLVSENFVEYILGRADEEWDYMDLSWKSLENNMFDFKLKSDADQLPNPSVCTKVWSRKFIGDLRFNEKKDVTEDEDFTRRINLSRGKRICSPDYMYYYRVTTPGSLSKQYRSGETKTKRIVYYFRAVLKNELLLEEIKETSEENEVVVMTFHNDMPELEQYARVTRPEATWANEARGEKINLIKEIKAKEKPMETQVVIYTNNTFDIGGIETFTYNFAKAMAKHYDITVLYGNADPKQLARLAAIVQVVHNDGHIEIDCDTLIMNRLQDQVPQNVHAKKIVQMVHGCREATSQEIHVPQDRDQIICVSETVKASFGDETKSAIVIKNMVETLKPRQVLQLVSATRLDTNEKGQKKMIELAERMNAQGVKFLWFYFANKDIKGPENMIKVEPTLNVRDYIHKADYLVQLSDTEGFGYSIVESLLEGTPVIVTDLPVLKEIGVEDGKNGYVLPQDLSEYDTEKFYTVPKVTYKYNNGLLVSAWKKVLGNTKPKGTYKPEEQEFVTITKLYFDNVLGREMKPGERVAMGKARAKLVRDAGFGV